MALIVSGGAGFSSDPIANKTSFVTQTVTLTTVATAFPAGTVPDGFRVSLKKKGLGKVYISTSSADIAVATSRIEMGINDVLGLKINDTSLIWGQAVLGSQEIEVIYES